MLISEDVMLAYCQMQWLFVSYIFLIQIQDFTQYLGNTVRVILIPSVRDAHHDFVFPQVCIFP